MIKQELAQGMYINGKHLLMDDSFVVQNPAALEYVG
jgi:hypothetical protein